VIFRPVATYSLIALNVAVYVLMTLKGASPWNPTPQQLIPWGADFGPLTLTSQPWRMITAAFVHIGFLHVLLNMVSLYYLGALAEAIYKRTAYLLIYVLSGVAGCVGSLMFFPLTVSAGASGAIFGIVGALIGAFKFGRLRLPPEVVKRELTTLFVFTGFNLLYGVVRTGLNNAAHLGGLAAGSLMGIIIAVAIRRHSQYRRARNLAVTLMIVIIVGGYLIDRELQQFIIHLDAGHEALTHGKFAQARDQLEMAVQHRDWPGDLHRVFRPKATPREAIAYGELAAAYTRLGDLPRAESALRRSIESNPRDVSARMQLAVLYYTQRKFSDASDTMRQVVQMRPDSPEVHEFFAQILAAAGSQQESQQEHARAVELAQQAQHAQPKR
jgi:membrane associated rhomboid family serine protease/Tfp pilus assembly protein PilF